MRRRLFTFGSIVGLLLTVATVALWVRSYATHDSWAWSNSGYVQLHSAVGEIELYWGVPNSGIAPAEGSLSFIWRAVHLYWGSLSRPVAEYPLYGPEPNMTVHWDFAGFVFAEHEAKKVRQSPLNHLIEFPYWSIVLIEVCILAILARAARRAWRASRRNGDCPTCGYDLTGNASGVCPECGTAVQKKAWARAGPALGNGKMSAW